MRILFLKETPIIEIQEASQKENDLYIDLGNMTFLYDRGAKQLYQYQEWPKQKEIAEKQANIVKMAEGEEQDKAVDEMKKWIKGNSKKVKYKVEVEGKWSLVDFIEHIINGEVVSKEYL